MDYQANRVYRRSADAIVYYRRLDKGRRLRLLVGGPIGTTYVGATCLRDPDDVWQEHKENGERW